VTNKKFKVSFKSDAEHRESCEGIIYLEGVPETFVASLGHFSKEAYVNQWTEAIQTASRDRKPAALFSNVDLEEDGTGWLWYYTLIPSEEVNYGGKHESGIYITHSFKPVCTNPKSFLTRKYVELEDGTKDEELALYFLDLKQPDRFFGYLDTEIFGRSHWFVRDGDM